VGTERMGLGLPWIGHLINIIIDIIHVVKIIELCQMQSKI